MRELFRIFVFLSLIVLSIVSLTPGLELSASTGGNGGSSSTNVRYGATVDDYANEHIQLNPEDGTLSNAFSGMGSLPLGSLTAQDSGNRATVSRSVVGKPGYTTWSYDWGTSNSNGAYAWIENMNVQNAYSITGAATASNLEGDSAVTQMSISSPRPTVFTASLSNYYASATATPTQATASQGADSASGSQIKSYVSASNVKDINNKDGLIASVSAGVVRGSIDIQQSATAANDFDEGVDAWQKIASASGDIIALNAKTSDISGKNKADSSVTAYNGVLQNYNSEAWAAYLNPYKKDIDLSAAHGPFQVGYDTTNPVGSIKGDWIYSEGSTTNQKGFTALYGVIINLGSVEGIFDWGTETWTDDGGVIAVPLESPNVWGAHSGPITISSYSIGSYSVALNGLKVASKDCAFANEVSVSVSQADLWKLPIDWAKVYGFAEPSEAKMA